MDFVNYVEKVSGVDIYGLTSFMIFFVFFIVIGVWAFKADRKVIDHLSNLPLNTDSENL
ncbi:MAG TPA: CcoQ/FixQ family Cbb3-type cytochrome c oxidase assembly chaperone [Panacibacter sp.]|nr:CcoQ/FixQ family Cbb3-type cytochrome c oxidase assembly chaperone [Panacibacter sp.]HNP43716.1 CcoQ/FixQ family Cbb3-type cytochrome c oxidase assembly chaperone [Panacibacter sp.]